MSLLDVSCFIKHFTNSHVSYQNDFIMKKQLLLVLFALLLLSSCIPTEELLPSGVTEADNINYIAFEPSTQATTGFIFYPGANISPESYNNWLEDLAELGYLAIVSRMPFNLAVLDVEVGLRIKNSYPQIQHWIIGGHSLGGAMATELVNRSRANEKYLML